MHQDLVTGVITRCFVRHNKNEGFVSSQKFGNLRFVLSIGTVQGTLITVLAAKESEEFDNANGH